MSERTTYAKNLARNTIAIVLTVEEWAGGPSDPLHLVCNDDGEWGHLVQSFIDAARDEDIDDECPIDHEDCMWFCDEDTARRALHHEGVEFDCDECGLTGFIKESRKRNGARMCRVCLPPRAPSIDAPKPAEPESLPLFPEGD